MSAGDRLTEPTDESGRGDLDDASNVLVLSPTLHVASRRSYFETLFPERPTGYDVLAIDYRQTPAQWVEEWKRHVGDRPRSCVVVSVDETRGSATSASTAAVPAGRNTAKTIDNPGDLTGLGITVSEYLSEQAGPQAFVTFDSLTVLLQYVELQRAFRFLHVLTNRVSTADALAHYHMDPAAHTEREVATLASLFDAVAEFDDGEWSVRSR
jgi:hypothetical protein